MKYKKVNLKKIITIICYIMLYLCILFTCYIMISSMNGKAVNLFGKSILKVVSGSMEPTIYAGDYILIENVSSNQLQKGDIIAFYSEDKAIYGMINTHRIIDINNDGSFITKGDANSIADNSYVSEDKIIGKYIKKIRLFKWINSFQSAKKLILLGIIILTLLMSIYECKTILEINHLSDEEKENIYNQKREKLIKESIEKEKKKLYEQHKHEQDTGGDKD